MKMKEKFKNSLYRNKGNQFIEKIRLHDNRIFFTICHLSNKNVKWRQIVNGMHYFRGYVFIIKKQTLPSWWYYCKYAYLGNELAKRKNSVALRCPY